MASDIDEKEFPLRFTLEEQPIPARQIADLYLFRTSMPMDLKGWTRWSFFQ